MSRPRFNRNEPGDWWFFLIVAAILTLIWMLARYEEHGVPADTPMTRCPACGGTGWLDDYQRDGCQLCGGGAYRAGTGLAPDDNGRPAPEAG